MAAAGLVRIVVPRDERIFRERRDLSHLREGEIVARYRLSSQGIVRLVGLLTPDLVPDTRRSQPIPVLTQVLVGLRFLAKGDFLSEIADLHGISRSSSCHIIDKFVNSVNNRLDNIKFPDDRNLLEIKQGFYRKCRIPNCIGAVDGTLIPILAPTENEEVYVCRKGYHALNVQAVVDNKGRFIDAVTKWPGSTHDASIFENCALKDHMLQHHNGHLLGDSGYPLRQYLLTPILHPVTNAETAYNLAQSRGRMVVERAFGLMKSRFRCLHKTGGCLMLKPGKCCRVVLACMRLHNMCVDNGEPMPPEPPVQEDGGDDDNRGQPDAGAMAYRDTIVRLFDN